VVGDVLLSNQTSAARAAFEQGQDDEAVSLYGQALRRAWSIDDPAAIADTSYNLAICLMGQGKFAEADRLLADADAESRRAGVDDVDVTVVQAKVALLLKDYGRAGKLSGEALRDAKADDALKIQARVIAGEAALFSGDSAAAKENLSAARAGLTAEMATKSPTTAASVEDLTGLLARHEMKPADAAGAFDREADDLRAAGRYGPMADALAEAGRSYEDAGDWRRGADRYFRAARSRVGMGNGVTVNAQATEGWLNRAGEAAEKAGDAELARRIEALRAGDGVGGDSEEDVSATTESAPGAGAEMPATGPATPATGP
jgi:tetratricopeptide (TPR) repeat protein